MWMTGIPNVDNKLATVPYCSNKINLVMWHWAYYGGNLHLAQYIFENMSESIQSVQTHLASIPVVRSPIWECRTMSQVSECVWDRVPWPNALQCPKGSWDPLWSTEHCWERVPRHWYGLKDWNVWGFILGSRKIFGQSPETPTHFNQSEGVELCPRSQNISETEFQDPNSFQCPRGCGVLSWGPDHFLG